MSRQLRTKALFMLVVLGLLFQGNPSFAQIQESGPYPGAGEIGSNPPDGGGEGGDADEILIRSRPEPLGPAGPAAAIAEQVSWIVRLMAWLGIGR